MVRPLREYFRLLVTVLADAHHAAAMVDDNGGVGIGLGQVEQFRELRKEQPGVVGQAQRRQLGDASPVFRIQKQPRGCGGEGIGERSVGIPGGEVAHASEASAAGGKVGFQDLTNFCATPQIGVAHDGFGNFGLAGCACGGRVRNEFSFADRAQRLRAFCAVASQGLHIHGCLDVMSRAYVPQIVVGQVGPVRTLIEVVMRVDDRQRRLKRGFSCGSQPFGSNEEVVTHDTKFSYTERCSMGENFSGDLMR